MAKINPRYVSTFRAPTEYERQLEEARRRAAMAEALAQQEYQPMEGTAAPIPAAAPLVKALQGYMTARAGRQAEEAKAAAEKAGRTEAVDYMRSFDPEQRTVGVGDIAAMEASRPYLEGGQLRYDPASVVAAPNQRLMPAMTPTGEIDVSQPMQMQVGGPLSIAQKRARALEGFESVNPMVRDFAVAQYEKTMPKEAEYGTTPQYDDQGRAYVINKAGDVRYLGGIKAPAAAPAAVTLATVVRNGRNVVVDARTGEEIGLAPSTPRDEPLMSIVGPDGKPVLVRRSQAEGQQPFVASASAGSSLSGDSATDRRKYRDNRLSLQNAMDSLTAFARQLQETPKEESITGDKAGRLSSAYKLALGAVRELQNTGVLNPGELPFIEDTLRDPQSLMQLFNPASRETITGQIEQIAGLLNNRALRNDELYGYDRRPLEGADIFRKRQTRSKF